MSEPILLPFQYNSLQSEESIRLLKILPGAEADHVECKLIPEISLNDLQTLSTGFGALSYAWGKQSPLFEITLVGMAFRVGPNLHAALKVMRYSDKPRIVWIDAICINQGLDSAALKERAIQVKKMQDIYGTAAQTVVWLGGVADGSNLAMDFITYQAMQEPMRASFSLDNRWRGWTTQDDYFYIVREPKYIPVWEAVFALCGRAYWSRMWIIQEITLSKQPVVCCGQKVVEWAHFELVIGLIFAMIGDRVPGSTYFWRLSPLLGDSFPLLLEQQRSQLNMQKGASWLLAALQTHRRFGATNDRDKVFALLGLAAQETRDSVRIDYEATLRDTYTRVFHLLVQPRRQVETPDNVVSGGGTTMRMEFTMPLDPRAEVPAPGFTSRAYGPLNILACTGYASSQRKGLLLWLPNWSDQQLRLSIDELTNRKYHASGDLEPEFSLSHDETVLEIKGFVLDGLRWLSSSPSDYLSTTGDAVGQDSMPGDDALVSSVADGLVEAVTAALAGHSFRKEDFWRTLVFDSFPTPFFSEAPDVWHDMEVDTLRKFVAMDELSDEAQALLPSEYIIMLRRTLTGRQFAVSQQGYYLVVPEDATVGDYLCVLWGCDIPVVLGQRDGKLVLIGECYCDILMDGSWMSTVSAADQHAATKTIQLS